MRENNFDAVAPIYDFLSRLVFGSTLLEAQLTFIDRIKPDSRVLILGGGTGRFLQMLLEAQPDLSVDYVEASKKMIDLSRKKAGSLRGIRFIFGTQEDVPETQYDVIITHFFLDVFKDPESIVNQLKPLLLKEGMWLCADFQITGKWHHQFLLWLMHRFFRFTSKLESRSIKPIREALLSADLQEADVQYWKGDLVFSGCYVPAGEPT